MLALTRWPVPSAPRPAVSAASDDATIEIELDDQITARLENTTVSLDLVRTDVAPERYLGILIQLPVVRPVTQPKSAA